ncbi:MAG: hypothetical protein AAGC93_16175 [Cyanobacteria bacterium P01_F01_bin.53]
MKDILKRKYSLKRLMSPLFWGVGLVLVGIILVGSWHMPSSASSLIDSRINQLEFQVRSVQTQLNQLQTQLPNPGGPSVSNVPTTIHRGPAPDELSLDEQFDNLATLVIEINQRVKVLESQLAGLNLAEPS